MINRVFGKTRVNPDRLKEYGFKPVDGKMEYSTSINDEFDLIVTYKESFDIKVLDKDYREEYLGYRYKDSAYGNIIATRIEEILMDIRDYACTRINYHSEQANRIDEYLRDVYGAADFPFSDDDNVGVYRESGNDKWYAIIMHVPYNKVNKDSSCSDFIDVMNVKADKKNLSKLLERDGLYPAYHMNKANWLSIILDDSLSDMDIILLVNESYDLVVKGINEKKYYRKRSY